MSTLRELKFVLCIGEKPSRQKFQTLLRGLARNGALGTQVPAYRFEVANCETRNEAMNCVREHLAVSETNAAILAFDIPGDRLAGNRETDARQPAQWAEELREIKANCATLAIMENPRRLPDIDRVIDLRTGSGRLLEVLKLLTDRLFYTSRPEKQTAPTPPVELRLISKQRELMDYFKLRHRIYKVMGYLEEEIENTPSQMEIDWCDTISLHFGAYAGIGDPENFLIGTARVVISSSSSNKRQALLDSYRQWVTALVNQDPVLQQSLRRGVLPLELPIFQSQKLSFIFREALRREEVCGELSRVIVAEDYRGIGLSKLLVEFALCEAAKVGVNRMFLECLLLHEKLYERFGFKRIDGARGTVISVNQTMIGMELSRPLGIFARAERDLISTATVEL